MHRGWWRLGRSHPPKHTQKTVRVVDSLSGARVTDCTCLTPSTPPPSLCHPLPFLSFPPYRTPLIPFLLFSGSPKNLFPLLFYCASHTLLFSSSTFPLHLLSIFTMPYISLSPLSFFLIFSFLAFHTSYILSVDPANIYVHGWSTAILMGTIFQLGWLPITWNR